LTLHPAQLEGRLQQRFTAIAVVIADHLGELWGVARLMVLLWLCPEQGLDEAQVAFLPPAGAWRRRAATRRVNREPLLIPRIPGELPFTVPLQAPLASIGATGDSARMKLACRAGLGNAPGWRVSRSERAGLSASRRHRER